MKQRQGGWTIWSLTGIIALIVAGALLFMKLMPVYLDNYKLEEAMRSVADDPRAPEWGKREMVREMSKILYIDYGEDIVNLHEALTVEKTDTRTYIKVEYEVAVPLVYNLSALVDFDNQVEIIR